MNEKLVEYINNRKIKNRNNLAKKLVDEGIYNKVYAPIKLVGHGYIKDDEATKLQFVLKDKNIKVGDTIKISFKGEKVDVIVDKIETKQEYTIEEYPNYEHNSELGFNHYFKKEPIEITDEEYEEVKKYIITNSNTVVTSNSIANAITFVAILEYICGFIAGFILGDTFEVDYDFNTGLMFATWIVSAISGTFILGFAEVIKLLQAIKDK